MEECNCNVWHCFSPLDNFKCHITGLEMDTVWEIMFPSQLYKTQVSKIKIVGVFIFSQEKIINK